ncbi:MAG TPA: superoxide dismutase [Burkholderiales bacterium]|nr:superoxide dismutase [Burkholderiales bacterium]
MKHTLPPLPYPLNALEPHVSAETLEFHHGKHHKTYVDKLNELIDGSEFENEPLEEIVKRSDGKIFNNAAQAWNHAFFWNCMRPAGGAAPTGALAQAIDKSFGSFDKFKDEFSKAAADIFGSGWAWLVQRDDGSLAVEPMKNADTPLAFDDRALLTLDVWEHAYYIDYRNRRPEFIAAFWNIVNWDFVSKNLGAATQQGQQRTRIQSS